MNLPMDRTQRPSNLWVQQICPQLRKQWTITGPYGPGPYHPPPATKMTLHTHSPNAHGSLDTSQALSPDSVIPTAPSSNTGKLTHHLHLQSLMPHQKVATQMVTSPMWPAMIPRQLSIPRPNRLLARRNTGKPTWLIPRRTG
ncbi:hypothetical protein MRB53_035103 [Persea americana]|uniref:Uncharacterized protein n=1 Tax=Persea americana TaxID=3435 RepID=A0ACC2K3M8_PERAE|nr:hypothetical protein MRB53_035103 [Persea americana]